MSRWKIVLVAAGLALAGWVLFRGQVHFGYIDQEEKAASQAIEKFHDRLNKGQYDEIYDDVDQALQNSVSRGKLIDAMQQTRSRWGGLKDVASPQVQVIVGAPVQIRASCNARFENGDATELFIFVRRGKDIRLARYEIQSGNIQPKTE